MGIVQSKDSNVQAKFFRSFQVTTDFLCPNFFHSPDCNTKSISLIALSISESAVKKWGAIRIPAPTL
jgi:hypothetical protein